MSKLFFEMTETEAQLQNILNSLEYAQYQMSTGINGYGNGTMTREEHQETERSVRSLLVVAMSGIQKCRNCAMFTVPYFTVQQRKKRLQMQKKQ